MPVVHTAIPSLLLRNTVPSISASTRSLSGMGKCSRALRSFFAGISSSTARSANVWSRQISRMRASSSMMMRRCSVDAERPCAGGASARQVERDHDGAVFQHLFLLDHQVLGLDALLERAVGRLLHPAPV